MYSVRRRLMLVLALGFTGLLAGATYYVHRVLRDRLTEQFDLALVAKSRALEALTESEDGRIELDYHPEHFPWFERKDSPDVFQFWLDDGRVLMRSKGLGRDLPRAPVPSTEPLARDVELPDGRTGRAVEWAWMPRAATDRKAAAVSGVPPKDAPPPPRGVVLAVAVDRAPLDDAIRGAGLAILGVAGLAAGLAILLVWRALIAGFRPIEQIADRVRSLDAERLDAPIDVPHTPAELAPFVDQLNALLARLRASFDRERRFTGNVAHELRTPIAELRALADVASRWPGDPASQARFFEDVRAISGRMEGLVGDLFLLARCQAGVEKVSGSPTPLRRAVESAWASAGSRSSERGLAFRLDVPPELVIESDPQKLSMILNNLLGNANSYALAHTEVVCSAARTEGGFRLDITNRADPLAPDDLDRITEPFWRKDASRTSDEHAGLGLALVAALASLLRLRVRFSQDGGGTFRATLEGGDALVAAPS